MEQTTTARFLRFAREAMGKRQHLDEEEGAESGFTLIELMVVLLIIAILLAIAIPTFLGVRGGAQDRAAQSDLTNALTSAKAYYVAQDGNYSNSTSFQSAMQASEPDLTWTTGTVSAVNGISFNVSTDGNIAVLSSWSADGRCWYAEDNNEVSSSTTPPTGATSTLGVSYAATATGQTSCSATLTTAPSSGWSSTYPT